MSGVAHLLENVKLPKFVRVKNHILIITYFGIKSNSINGFCVIYEELFMLFKIHYNRKHGGFLCCTIGFNMV